jgi:hypothetical protein
MGAQNPSGRLLGAKEEALRGLEILTNFRAAR